MAVDPKTGRQIREVARERRDALAATGGLPAIRRVPQAKTMRDVNSARDLKQIEARQEVEALDEAFTRRKRR